MRIRFAPLFPLLALASACTDAALPTATDPAAGPAATILIDGVAAQPRLEVGDSLVPRVRARSAATPYAAADVRWRVSDSTVALVDDGRIVALRSGAATATAQVGGASASMTFQAFGATRVERLRVEPRALALRVGEQAEIAAHLQYSNGTLFALRGSAAWKSLDPAVASVAGGIVVARGIGTARIVASLLGMSDTAVVTVAQPVAIAGAQIAVTVQRTGAGSGVVAVAGGIPLEPGALRAGDERRVRLFLEPTPGAALVEQPVSVQILKGRHRDGSARAVLVRFSRSIAAGASIAGRLTIDDPRPAAADLPNPGTPVGLPAAVVLPSDPRYLVRTELVGRTQTAQLTTARGGVYADFDANFARWADYHWSQNGAQWEVNYYDRALIYYAMWVRTGRVDYWVRATQHALAYRRDYLEASNYAATPYWSMLEGIEQHYLATGDPASHFTIGRMGEQFVGLVEQLNVRSDWMESRNQARTLQALFLAWRLDAPSPSAPRDWGALLDRALDVVLSTQEADGSYRWPIFCNSNGNFMYGLLNDQLIDHYTYYKADPRIPASVGRSVDHLWATQWLSDADGFKYSGVLCSPVGGPAAAPDLTAMQAHSFAWVASVRGSAADRARAERVFASGVRGAYYIGAKQFNEAYTSSWLALGYLVP